MILIWASMLVFVLWGVYSCIRPRNYPPGPAFMPFIGNLLHYRNLHKATGYHHLIWLELAKQHGPVVGMKLGKYYIICIIGAAPIREMLLRDEFDGRPDGFFFRVRTFGKRQGILFTDGQMWRKQRKFSLHHLRMFGLGRKQLEEKIRNECDELVEHVKKICHEPLFMHDLFDAYVINALWSMLAGQRFDVDDERLKKLMIILHECCRTMDISGGLLNQAPILRHIAPSATGYNKVMEVLTEMQTFMKEVIDEHRREKVHQPRDLIDAFLQMMEIKPDNSFTDEQLLCVCIDLFMAGAETSSGTLAYAIMYMVTHPEVQQKVQQEMDKVVGRSTYPTLDHKVSLKYTEAVLLELLRIINVAPMAITHRATKDTTFMGYNIPQDTLILPHIYSLHMDEDHWKQPHRFKPERFLNEKGEVWFDDNYYMPFGLGKRRCLGETLAKTNLYLFLTGLLHNFTFEAVPECYPDITPNDGITLAPKPFKVKITVRD